MGDVRARIKSAGLGLLLFYFILCVCLIVYIKPHNKPVSICEDEGKRPNKCESEILSAEDSIILFSFPQNYCMEVETQTLSHFSYSLDGNDISHDLRTHESPRFEMLSEEAQVTNSCDTDDPVGGACLDSAAAVKLQKVYRGYRTRRRLADSAVVAEELWQVI